MTIEEVKQELGYDQLNFARATTEEGEDTDWLRHWDNDNRVAISIHEDTAVKVEEEGPKVNLGIQKEEREGSKGKYMAYRIVAYKPAEFVF